MSIENAATRIADLFLAGGDWNTDQLAAIIRDEVGAPADQAYPIPGPYEIAMQFGAALAASGNYKEVGAAMAAAWFAVPQFYQARDQYLQQIAPIMYPGNFRPADEGEGGAAA